MNHHQGLCQSISLFYELHPKDVLEACPELLLSYSFDQPENLKATKKGVEITQIHNIASNYRNQQDTLPHWHH